MIKKFKIFEKIEWYKDGEFIEDDSPEESRDLTDPVEFFKQFLIDNDAYENYLYNVESQRGWTEYNLRTKLTKTLRSMDWINGPLDWASTRERSTYWNQLNDRWKIFRDQFLSRIMENIEWYKDGEFIEEEDEKDKKSKCNHDWVFIGNYTFLDPETFDTKLKKIFKCELCGEYKTEKYDN